MNILAFDTSTTFLDIAISTPGSDRSQYASTFKHVGLTHSELLIPEIISLCEKINIKPRDFDLIICSRGPGSFTGLRIGMATAKGLAKASDIPIISIPSLDTYAAQSDNSMVIPMIDARKRRFYTALYVNGKRESDYLDISPDHFYTQYLQDFTGKIAISGPNAELFIEALDSTAVDTQNSNFSVVPYSSAAEILLKTAQQKLLENGPDSDNQGPLYIRSSI